MHIGKTRVNDSPYLFGDHGKDIRFKVSATQYLAALLVYQLTVLINNIVIFNEVFTYIKMIAFNALLNIANQLVNQGILNRSFLIHTRPAHDTFNSVAAETPHDIIFQR